MNPLTKISILIVTKKWSGDARVFSYIDELNHTNIDSEVLLAEGDNPSSQRNILAKTAAGEFILFLDDDSRPISNLLVQYRDSIQKYPGVEIAGGPSLLKGEDNLLFNLTKIFFSSTLGIGPVKSRYNSLGFIRKASERELILCNLLMRKDFFLKTKGFDQDLYPGEENEFLKSLHASTSIIYDPNAIVYRRPRDSLSLFLEQMISYGKGRSKHLRLSYLYDYLFLIPLFFTLYILSLPFLVSQSTIWLIPLHLYLLLTVLTLILHNENQYPVYQKFLLPPFFLIGHLGYGVGLMMGVWKYKAMRCFVKTGKQTGEIKIHRIKNFKKNAT